MKWFILLAVMRYLSLAEGQDLYNNYAPKPCTHDYYWRDYYNKTIPDDAISGGVNEAGHTFYLGQAFYEGHQVQPVSIDTATDSVTVCASRAVATVNTMIKVLCAKNKDRFRWQKMHLNDYKNLEDGSKLIVRGGWETAQILYIGRVGLNYYTIGRVYSTGDPYTGVWIPTLDETKIPFQNADYEILTYLCTKY